MRIRYGTSKSGKRVELARIYTAEEHGISRDQIDRDAVRITDRLQAAGHQAYIVGGAVRDLLVGKHPKDFDVATDAHPRAVRKLFHNARIIGKRFRLVHVEFSGKIVEVSTFRSQEGENDFGTIEEDARRRDFTMNALYYAPDKQEIVDYVGGFEDVRAGRMQELVPLETTFIEDPVRMIRAVKYSVGTGFALPPKLRTRIRKCCGELARCSASRMTEEMLKILQSGNAAPIVELARQLGIFPYMLVALNGIVDQRKNGVKELVSSLSLLDAEVRKSENALPRSRAVLALVDPFIEVEWTQGADPSAFYKSVFANIKGLIQPITPPNADVHEATKALLAERGIAPPPKPRRRRRHAGSRPPH